MKYNLEERLQNAQKELQELVDKYSTIQNQIAKFNEELQKLAPEMFRLEGVVRELAPFAEAKKKKEEDKEDDED